MVEGEVEVEEGGGGGGGRWRWKEVEGVDEKGIRPQVLEVFLQSSRCVRLCPVSSQNPGKET